MSPFCVLSSKPNFDETVTEIMMMMMMMDDDDDDKWSATIH